MATERRDTDPAETPGERDWDRGLRPGRLADFVGQPQLRESLKIFLEAAVARAPEVILLADHAGSGSEAGRAAPEKWQALTSVPAIRAGRLHSVNLDVLHRYGPRIADGLESLARLIHPEAFP